jgi:hypothetical protein
VPSKFDISIAGHHFSIPEAYRRKDDHALTIDAVSPDFVAYAPTYDRYKLRYWQHSYNVRIVRASSANLLKRFDQLTASATSTEALAPQSNLKVTQLFRGKFPTLQILTASDDAGHITDLIDCDWNLSLAEPHCRFFLRRVTSVLNFSLTIQVRGRTSSRT